MQDASPAPIAAATAVTDFTAGAFSENMGQLSNPDVLYYSASAGVGFCNGSVLLHSRSGDNRSSTLRITFPGSGNAAPTGVNRAPWTSNFFMGSHAEKWRSGVVNYGTVEYRELWPGIDLVYRLTSEGLKYDLLVSPGADISRIRFGLEGHESLRLDGDSLMIGTGLGPGTNISDSGLDVFYADATWEKIRAEFMLLGPDEYGFSVGSRDVSRALVIDPLMFSTFLGGSGNDRAMAVASDSLGNQYIVGTTDSPDFPTTLGVLEPYYNGYSEDVFVAKLSPGGDSLLYSTYLGDEGRDYGMAIAVDSQGCAYITGYTGSHNFPTTASAFDRSYNGGGHDAFVAKLGPDGDTLLYSTYIGGIRNDYGYGIAVDSGGYAYVTGGTYSGERVEGGPQGRRSSNYFPVTYGAFNTGAGDYLDVFVTKFDQSGSKLVFSSVFGGEDDEQGNGIAVDSSGYCYVVGQTRSSRFPTSPGAFDRSHNGGYDTFVTKLTRTGEYAFYSTYLGGAGADFGRSIAVGQWGDAYITGYTNSPGYPTTPGSHRENIAGNYDAFVTAVNKYGGTLLYSTFLGGSNADYGYAIAMDNTGCALVAGLTYSEDMETTPTAYDRSYNGNGDGFVAKISPGGQELRHSTFLGGGGFDSARGISIAANADTIIVGETGSYNFPTIPGSMDRSYNGLADAFVTGIDLADPVADPGPDTWINEGQVANFNGIRSTDNHAIVNYTWRFFNGTGNHTLHNVTASHRFMVPGIYEIILEVIDLSGNRGQGTMLLDVRDITLPVAVAGPDFEVDEGTVVGFNGSASSDNVGIANHTWAFAYGGGEIELWGPMPYFKFVIPGIYAVTLTVRDAAGNSAKDWLNITVRDITAPRAHAGRDRSIRQNSIFRFNGSLSRDNVGITSYSWQFHDGAREVALEGMMPEHTFTVVGVYQVTLTVRDAAGLQGRDNMTLTVLEIVNPVAVAGPDFEVDEQAPAIFDGTASSDNVGVAFWSWHFHDGRNNVTLYGPEPEWRFPVPGSYLVSLNASDAAGNWDTDTVTVTVLDALDPVPIPGPNRIVRPGEEFVLDGTGSHDSSGISRYIWSFTHNGTYQELDGPGHTLRLWSPGTYHISLEVTDSAGKTSTGSMTVTVLDSMNQEQAMGFPVMSAIASVAMLGVAAILWVKAGKGAGP